MVSSSLWIEEYGLLPIIGRDIVKVFIGKETNVYKAYKLQN